MTSGVGRSWFVGCACDRNFVQHTAVMLASLDANGDIPEATVVVASFGLTADDFATLRAGAGRLGAKMRMVEVTDEMVGCFAGVEFREMYPLPVLGRLFIPSVIEVPGARLLTLDSDMIVNGSVRPLLELDMNDQYLAAIHDVPRIEDLNYFNTGLLLIEVDGYKRYDVAQRAITWLAEQTSHPTFPDQDALNNVVGDRWYRLDRSWNWFYTGPDRGDLPLETSHYLAAKIAHFAGGKPWNHYDHPGGPLYRRYLDRLRENIRAFELVREHVDASFVATAFEMLLGMELVNDKRVSRWTTDKATQIITRLVRSTDFALNVILPLKIGRELTNEAWQRPLRVRDRMWAADRLPVGYATRVKLEQAASWRELLTLLLDDDHFTARVGLKPLLAFADAMLAAGYPETGRAGDVAANNRVANDVATLAVSDVDKTGKPPAGVAAE
jgi:lipopolysaccharide biosynthesis glycosyltransferase